MIERVLGRRVWDSRGRPTVEAEVHLESGALGRAIAPAGASTGSGEAKTIDTARAVLAINTEIADALRGHDQNDQTVLDATLIALDGTPTKLRLGANALVAVSMAAAHAAAREAKVPLWRHLAGSRPVVLPLPEIQIFGGGAHAGRRVDVQDFMVIATGAEDYTQALDWTASVYQAAGSLLQEAGLLYGVADEGGYWPAFNSNRDALDMLLRAIERAGLRPGEQMSISLDIAASQFGNGGVYRLGLDKRELDSAALTETLLDWIRKYPIVAIEDPLAEDDPAGFAYFTAAAGRIAVVGDDLLVTNATRIREAAAKHYCNTVLIKPNQAGTLTETKAAFDATVESGLSAIVSARSGESENVTIMHLAVGWGAPILKVGSFARSERMAKWNEGLRIAEALGGRGSLPPQNAFPWL